MRQREPVPDEVEAPLDIVERDQDTDDNRHEEVQQREARPEPERLVAERVPAPRAGEATPATRGPLGRHRRASGFDGSYSAASVRFRVPSAFAYANTARRITPINMNDSAAAVG